jgi:NAD(P)-dependent dehydrogenase (short-subunit alcohol dehydrogenase family)
VPAEVAEFEQVRAVAEEAVAAYGRLDTWVHLPAASVYARFDELNTPFFDKARSKLGAKPMGSPPFYQPSVVANALVYAAEHGPRDLVVGGAARALLAGQALSPRAMDVLLLGGAAAIRRAGRRAG